ncbi:hypothetical protein D3C76_1176370 [compost metagenome]|jgi:hypothetical protein|uniref:Uncharacterized protein n=1 Tax=Paenibacillus illinoisensis TaxID=59845 RepID=A0A2W0CIJ9_9BACL|nr:hypothetical protein PIL02S_00773 [Paenibacillus illinoisensis]
MLIFMVSLLADFLAVWVLKGVKQKAEGRALNGVFGDDIFKIFLVIIVIGALNMWISGYKPIKLSLSTCVHVVHRLGTCSGWILNFFG